MKFLVFQHVPHEPPGLIGDYAKNNTITLDILELWKPYSMPQITDYDALVIMGGPMGVYEGPETFPSKDDELLVIKEAISKNIPIIGFCLGSQLIAHALGSKVYPNIKDGKKVKEVGYYTVDLTTDGQTDPLFKTFSSPVTVLQWHGDAFDLPDGATLLGSSPVCTNQVFRYGENVYGMLFHNEFTPDMVANMIKIDNKWIHEEHELDEEKFQQQAEESAEMMKKQCFQLMDNFVDIVNK
ncbi:MAG: type 1 glutamine amidotransferase [Weeksellaceae bacterium]